MKALGLHQALNWGTYHDGLGEVVSGAAPGEHVLHDGVRVRLAVQRRRLVLVHGRRLRDLLHARRVWNGRHIGR